MIDQHEITSWAERFGVAHEQVVRDHLVSHLIAVIGASDDPPRFFGGTALCRTHLDGSRLSEDIDLLARDPGERFADLRVHVQAALRREFPRSSWSPDEPEGDGWRAYFQAADVPPVKVYVGRDGVDTRAWEFVETGVALRYTDLPGSARFQCPTLSTFAAMKLVAWYDRHAPRDLYDLAGLAAIGALDIANVERLVRAKVGHGLIRSELTRLPRTVEDSWRTELGAQVGDLPDAQVCLERAARAFSGGSG